eukprot:COSAG06_NODE_1017_length_11063_cov_23.106439_10_plen_21_part_01
MQMDRGKWMDGSYLILPSPAQ